MVTRLKRQPGRRVRIVLFIVLCAGALLAAAQGPFAEQPPARIALLIGNQSYEPSVGVLKNPHNDIALLSRALEGQGYQVLPLVKDATRVQILAAVRELARRLNAGGAGAVGFLYYSGHGAAEADTRRNYLIPIDAKYPGTESFWDESVRLDDILGLLNGASAAAKFVVFDACRNELRLPYRGAKGFEPVREQPGVYVAYTTAPGQPALDDGETSGPYAAALAAEFAKPGQDHLSLFQNVKEAVYAATRGAQQPWATDGLVRRVYLTGQPQPAREKPAPEKADEAAQAWSAVQNTSSEAVLKNSLAGFRKRLCGLRQGAASGASRRAAGFECPQVRSGQAEARRGRGRLRRACWFRWRWARGPASSRARGKVSRIARIARRW